MSGVTTVIRKAVRGLLVLTVAVFSACVPDASEKSKTPAALEFGDEQAALGASENSLDRKLFSKYPIDSVRSEALGFPNLPIDAAINYLSCAPAEGVNQSLVDAIKRLSDAHFLDDLEEEIATLEGFHSNGEPIASLLYASILDEGLFLDQDNEAAREIYEGLLLSNDPFAVASSAYLLHYFDPDDEENNLRLFEVLELALKRHPNSAALKAHIAYFIDEVYGIESDTIRIKELFAEAYRLCPNSARAAADYGEYLWRSSDYEDIEGEGALGRSILASLENTNNATVLFILAMWHRGYGEDVKAVELFELSSDLGNPIAAQNAAEMLSEIDHAESTNYLKRAAHLGVVDAIHEYAELLRDGSTGIPADPQASLAYFEALRVATGNWKPSIQTLELIGNPESLAQAVDLYSLILSENGLSQLDQLQVRNGLARVSQKLGYFSQVEPPSALAAQMENEPPLNAGRFKALIIGNGGYKSLPSLNTPVSDARRVAELLEKKYGFETTLLLDGSRSDLINALNRMRKSLREQDNFLLFYAGHGVYDSEVDEGYWQPVDASSSSDAQWVSNSRITTTLRGFKSRNVLVVADSCYSGVLLRGSDPDDARASSVMDRRAYLQRLLEKKTRVALTSGGVEPVADGLAGEDGSVFTGAFLRVLESSEEPLSGQEIYLKVSEEVVRVSAAAGIQQTPEFAGILQSGHDGGDFIFVPR